MKNLLFFVLAIIGLTPAYTQSWQETQKLVASDRNEDSFLGSSVAIDSSFAVVGVQSEAYDASGSNYLLRAGAAYVFEKDTAGNWSEVQKLVASDRAESNSFGQDVTISGNYIVIGAYGNQTDRLGMNPLPSAGAVYIFERDQNGVWNEVEKLVASDRSERAHFGFSLAIEGNILIVGAFKDGLNSEPGSAYTFERDSNGSWNETQKVEGSNSGPFDWFGYSISIKNEIVVITAVENSTDETGGNLIIRAGAAYIFEKDQNGIWQEKQKLVATDRVARASFGYSSAMDDRYLIISAINEKRDLANLNEINSAGAVYIFEKDEKDGIWIQRQKLIAPSRLEFDNFGHAVAINKDYAIIGVPLEDEDSTEMNTLFAAGSAYILKRDSTDSWNHYKKISNSNREAGDAFGLSVALDGNIAFIGSTGNNYDAAGSNFKNNAGMVYVYEGPEEAVNSTSIPQNEFENSLTLYPNPTSGVVTVKLGQTYQSIRGRILNMIGQTVSLQKFQHIDQIQLEVKGPKGIYFLEITTEKYSGVLRIIKQ